MAAAPAVSPALADPPYDPAIELQLFDYAVGPSSFLTVEGAEVSGRGYVSVDFLVTFLTDPLTVYEFSRASTARRLAPPSRPTARW